MTVTFFPRLAATDIQNRIQTYSYYKPERNNCSWTVQQELIAAVEVDTLSTHRNMKLHISVSQPLFRINFGQNLILQQQIPLLSPR